MGEWRPDREQQLREWRRQGFSYELIARMFTAQGFKRTKGGVIGHAYRLGDLIGVLKKKPRYQLDNHASFKNPIRSGAALFDKIKATRPAAACPPTPAAAGEFLALELLELDFGQCRYPQGDGPIVFCGQPVRPNSTYCDRHHKLCHTRSSW